MHVSASTAIWYCTGSLLPCRAALASESQNFRAFTYIKLQVLRFAIYQVH